MEIVIIGAGPGGYTAALRAAALGGKVTLVEEELPGGTCLNYGCIPSKIMKNSADVFGKFLKAENYGIHTDGKITLDINSLMEKKNRILENQRKGLDTLFQKSGIKIEKGRADLKSFCGEGRKGLIEVTSDADERKLLEYDKLIIAAGSKPFSVKQFAFDHTSILSSNDLLMLRNIPDSMIVAGGGVIGCEFAFIYSSFGAQVTIIEGMSRLLPIPSLDDEISKLLAREMKKRKIKVLCDTVIESVSVENNKVSVNLKPSPFTDNENPQKLKTDKIEAEKLAVCIGRQAVSLNADSKKNGLAMDEKGWIKVNEKMETNIPGIYAVGDILGPEKIMLAHVAYHEGMTAAQNAMGQESVMDYSAVPGAVFTTPEIAMVGLSMSQAQAKNIDVTAFTVNFRSLGKAQAIDEIAGTAKIVVEKNRGTILGAHVIGAHATDLIGEMTLAVKHKMSVQDVAHTIHAHPTLSEIWGELALKASGRELHG